MCMCHQQTFIEFYRIVFSVSSSLLIHHQQDKYIYMDSFDVLKQKQGKIHNANNKGEAQFAYLPKGGISKVTYPLLYMA